MPSKNQIMLVLVDGFRPDALSQADVPNINKLIHEGAYSLYVRTVIPSVTLPCITSIFLGVPPEEHGTVGNYWNSSDWAGTGLIDLIHKSGGKTASFYNWEQLRDISCPGSLDVSICLNQAEAPDLPLGDSDVQVTDSAIQFLVAAKYDFVFVYLGGLDTAGHRHGWMSAEYLHTLENADRCIGRLLQNLPKLATVIIASDHGGHDQTHGSEVDVDMTVPLIFHGAGIKPVPLPPPVSVLDIAPTVASIAGLVIPKDWKGKRLF